MIVHDHYPQNSQEWFDRRRGRPTASQFSKIITAKTGALSKSADAYMAELVAECLCEDVEAFTGNKWTDRGNELEGEARAEFAEKVAGDVREVGFVTRDDGVVGCSPDGLIYETADDPIEKPVAGLEIKCPGPKAHVAYVLNGTLPDAYKQQVHGGMAVTGLDRWHFYSWFPGIDPLHIVVERDDYTEKLSAALDLFLVSYGKFYEKAMPKLKGGAK